MAEKVYYSVPELAGILNISRIAVFNKIKKGQIKAEKVGRNYIIKNTDLVGIVNDGLTANEKKKIERGVKKS